MSVWLHILPHHGHRWSALKKSAKCSVGEHLGFFFMLQRPDLFMGWLFFYCTIWAGFHKHWWLYDGSGKDGLHWKGQAQGVRGDTSESFSLASTQFISHTLSSSWLDFTFSKMLFHAAGKMGRGTTFIFPQFPISLNYGRFIDIFSFVANKGGFIWGTSTLCLTVLNGKFICIYFVAFSQRQTVCIPHTVSPRANMRGKKEGFEGAGWMGNACQVFLCIAEMKIKTGKDWGTVRVPHVEWRLFGELLEPVQACSNTDSVFMCRGMTCAMQARLVWARAKCENGESVINKEGGKQESDMSLQ